MALQLLSEMTDVHVERALVRGGGTLIESGRQLVAADGSSGGTNENLEYVELQRGDCERLAKIERLPRLGIELQAGRLYGIRGGRFRMPCSSQNGSDARQQFVGAERLGQVIVGAAV